MNGGKKWSKKYKRSINCSRPRGFSQRAHCAHRRRSKGRSSNKRRSSKRRSSKKGLKCWPGYVRVKGKRAGTKGSCRKRK